MACYVPPSESETQTEMRWDEKISEKRWVAFFSLSHIMHQPLVIIKSEHKRWNDCYRGWGCENPCCRRVNIFLPRAPRLIFTYFIWMAHLTAHWALISGINRFFSIVSNEGMRTAGDKSFFTTRHKHDCSSEIFNSRIDFQYRHTTENRGLLCRVPQNPPLAAKWINIHVRVLSPALTNNIKLQTRHTWRRQDKYWGHRAGMKMLFFIYRCHFYFSILT